MKRQTYKATLTVDGTHIGDSTAYAFNSTVRASEALLRDYARSIGCTFQGERPNRSGDVYTRNWSAGDIKATTIVQPSAAP